MQRFPSQDWAGLPNQIVQSLGFVSADSNKEKWHKQPQINNPSQQGATHVERLPPLQEKSQSPK